MSDIADPPAPARAMIRRSRRLSIIWIIPILAVAIGAWLAWDTLSKEGPTITISFDSGEGSAGRPVAAQIQGYRLWHGQEPRARARPHACHRDRRDDAAGRAAADRQNDLLGGQAAALRRQRLRSRDAAVRVPISACCRREAGARRSANSSGRRIRRSSQANVPGHTFLLKAKRLGSISLGSPMFFRDLNVGEVLGWDIADMAE